MNITKKDYCEAISEGVKQVKEALKEIQG